MRLRTRSLPPSSSPPSRLRPTTAPRTLLPKRAKASRPPKTPPPTPGGGGGRLAARWLLLRAIPARLVSSGVEPLVCGSARVDHSQLERPAHHVLGVGGERVGGGAGRRRRRRARWILLATLGAVLMCEATALFGQAVLCAIFAANDPAQIDTSTALILLILVAVEEGQGFILFLCFGLQPEVVASITAWASAAWHGGCCRAKTRRGAELAAAEPPITDPLLIYSSVMPLGSPAAPAPARAAPSRPPPRWAR